MKYLVPLCQERIDEMTANQENPLYEAPVRLLLLWRHPLALSFTL